MAAKVSEKKKYKCYACGLETNKYVNTTFYTSNSILYEHNDHYIPVCRNCLSLYYTNTLKDCNGHHALAIERMCQTFDWYYDSEIVDIALKTNTQKSMIEIYQSKACLVKFQRRGTTYRDTIRRRQVGQENILPAFEDAHAEEPELVTPTKPKSRKDRIFDNEFITDDIRRFWGKMYSDDDIQTLQTIYDELAATATANGYDLNTNITKRMAAKNVALLSYKLQREIANEGKNISTLTSAYLSMLKQSGLDQENEINTEADTFGCWIRDIQKYTPAEYYNDPEKYKDYFGGEDYIQRFLARPFKNLFTGSKNKDQEFNIDGS